MQENDDAVIGVVKASKERKHHSLLIDCIVLMPAGTNHCFQGREERVYMLQGNRVVMLKQQGTVQSWVWRSIKAAQGGSHIRKTGIGEIQYLRKNTCLKSD